MGKPNLLSSSIKNLKINEPFALKGQKELKWKPPQNEAPQIEKPQIKQTQNELPRFEGGGFFKVCHSIFEQPVIRRLSGDCFRLYLWLSSLAWRFPDSDGTIHASVSFIVQKTGISHASASRGLQQLKDQKLIELICVDFKKGNLWRVVPPFEPPRKEVPQSKGEATSKRSNTSHKMREELPQIEAEIKNSQEIQKHPTLRAYFAALKPFGKRKREWESFLKLSKDFKSSEIGEALAWIQTHGVGEQKQICHSPMAYLSQAMGSVLDQINSAKNKTAQTQLNRELFNQKIHEQTQEEIDHEKERKEKEEAFIKKYPHSAEQEKIIDQYSKSNTWIQTPELKRAWGINQWWTSCLRVTE